jgi:hypothetical protein
VPVLMAPTYPPVLERLAEKSVMDFGGCWTYTGALTRGGYGQIWWKGKNNLAHRVSYELHHGPAPAGLQLDHLCRNRACINPVHLEPVTARVNTARNPMNAATFQLSKTRCPKGHAYDEINTIRRPGTGHRQCRKCVEIRKQERKSTR